MNKFSISLFIFHFSLFTLAFSQAPVAQFTATPTTTCSGSVSFTDKSSNAPTSWLWNFGDAGTSTMQNPAHTYTANGTYTVSLKATNASGNNTNTKPNYIKVQFGTGPMVASCTPQTTANCCGFGITNVKFKNTNNTSADGSEGYKDFSCTVDTLMAGQTYTISINGASAPSGQNYQVWIDFNNDGIFNPSGESVFSTSNVMLATGSFFIPGTATLNTPLRLRISADQSLEPVPTPCSNVKYGQAEDYGIYIKPSNLPPVAKFTVDDSITCSGTVQFTDQSSNVPTQWLWNFGDGNTSPLTNPSHTYTANGTYSVSLLATNANGNNTLVKTNYIKVTLGNIPIAASCSPATLAYCCGYGIYNVKLNTINRSSADGSEGYKDFSCANQTSLTEGQTYSVSIQTHATLVQDTKLWIDFNNDGTFNQANELLFNKANTVNPSGTFLIPTGVAVYNTVLRMRVLSDNGGSNPTACTVVKGQAEDYGVTIQKFVGVEENEKDFDVTVFPNPSAGKFQVSSLKPQVSSVEVFNFLGEMIFSSTTQQLNNSTTLDLTSHPNGIYFLQLRTNSETVSKKIIIQK